VYDTALAGDAVVARTTAGTTATMEPAPYAVVTVGGSGERVTANADGRFSVDGVEPGRRVVRAVAAGNRAGTATVDVTAGATASTTIVLSPHS
jgi:Carboxypeptidase regulatory-like domain